MPSESLQRSEGSTFLGRCLSAPQAVMLSSEVISETRVLHVAQGMRQPLVGDQAFRTDLAPSLPFSCSRLEGNCPQHVPLHLFLLLFSHL